MTNKSSLRSQPHFKWDDILFEWIKRFWKLFQSSVQALSSEKKVRFLQKCEGSDALAFKVNWIYFFILSRWYHSCVVLTGLDEDTVFAKVQIFSQGQLQLTKEFTTILDPVQGGNGILILGQEQDSFGGGFDKFQSFQGEISQFNMYNRLTLLIQCSANCCLSTIILS